MKLVRLSIRTHLSGIILAMGVAGLALALATGEFYRHLILENQRDSLGRIAELKVAELVRELDATVAELGVSLQHQAAFRRAMLSGDRAALEGMLRQQFHRYFATAGVLDLRGFSAFDTGFRERATAWVDDSPAPAPAVCPTLQRRAAERQGAERIRLLGGLCRQDGAILHNLLVPIGGLRPFGYLSIMTDPVEWLARMEAETVMPVLISGADGEPLFVSQSWPAAPGAVRSLSAATDLPTLSGSRGLRIAIASDTRVLEERLDGARYAVMTVSGLLTALIAGLSFFVFRTGTLVPLKQLTRRLRVLRSDRDRLGEAVRVTANAEIEELAEGFNELSSDLRELHETLESLAYNDHLTGLPNRALFQDRLQQQALRAEREGTGFALLVIDLDRFKAINDTLGHHAGDAVLEQVGARLKRALRRSDTLARTSNTVARMGGDEFSVILPAAETASGAARAAMKLLNTVQKPCVFEGAPVRIGMSIGIALYPEDTVQIDQLYRYADKAMYVAKRERRGFAFHHARSAVEDGRRSTTES